MEDRGPKTMCCRELQVGCTSLCLMALPNAQLGLRLKRWTHTFNNQMIEQEAIKMETLHLEGEAHDQWFHILTTLGHAQIVSYEDFTKRVVEQFDQRDLQASFRELTQLCQTGKLEQYLSNFLCVSVMVSDFSKARMVYTFIKGFPEPLCGLVKSRRPSMLQEVLVYAKDLQGNIPKTRAPFHAWTPFPQKGHETRTPLPRTTQGRGQLDEDTWKDLQRRKLCFTCRDPWAPGHKCTVGRAHYIKVFSDSDQDDEVEQDCGGVHGES